MKKIFFVLLLMLFLYWSADAEEQGRSRLIAIRTGSGPDVVLLPGLGCPAAVYAELLAALAPTHRCHVLQIPGFAGQGLAGSESASDWVLEVQRYLEDNRLSAVTLIGHSFGGWLALQVAARTRAVARLIVIDAAPFPAGLFQDVSPEQAPRQAAQLPGLFASMSDEQHRAFEAQRLALMVADPAAGKRILEWLCATPRSQLAALSAAMTGSDLRPLLPEIKASTLVLGSWTMGRLFGLDRAGVEKRLQWQYNALKGCAIHMAERAGHFIMLDEPGWLEGEVRTFLEEK
jgi:pimeloyl-ACP methyl ester carboxylesterase